MTRTTLPPAALGTTGARRAPRALTQPPVLLAVAAVVLAAAWGGLLLAPRPPAEGSPEAGFARDMTVHHEQAVVLAGLVRDRTRDPQVRAVATDVLYVQQAQVGQFTGWLEAWGLPRATQAPAMAWMGHPTTGPMPGMAGAAEVRRLQAAPPSQVDAQFVRLMVPHHQAGVAMAQAVLEQTRRPEVRRLAEQLVAGQQAEVDWMQGWLRQRELPAATPAVTMPAGDQAHHGGGMTASLWPRTRNAARYLPLAAGLFAATWLVVDATRRRRRAGPPSPLAAATVASPRAAVAWQRLAVASLAASGLIHRALAAEHFELGVAYGVFFVAAGMAAVVVAATLLARPSSPAATAGTVLAAGLLTLYGLFRLVPPPGASAPEDVELVGLVTQAVQLLGLAACVVLGHVLSPTPRPDGRSR